MSKVLLGVTLIAACGVSDPDHSIGVAANAMGVATLQTARFTDSGDRVFELHGLSAAGVELGLVRLRIHGDEGALVFGSGSEVTSGSEILFSVGGHEAHWATSDRNVFRIQTTLAEPQTQAFLNLDEVASVLEREANIIVDRAAPDGEVPFFIDPGTSGCDSSLLNTSPVAQQCCWTIQSVQTRYTTFVADTNHDGYPDIVTRQWTSYGACTGPSGASCSGSACYFGPNRFGRPGVWLGSSANPYTLVFDPNEGTGACQGQFYTSPQSPQFSDVTGTYPTGQGCPGSESGAGDWDY